MNKCQKDKLPEHFRNLRFQKKAQESRLDMAVWYGLCVFVIALVVCSVYSIDMIGDSYSKGGQMTGAVVVDFPEEDSSLDVNETEDDDISLYSDDK
ncbi:hypothetical protein KY332_03075 [Candidatus Woesearchaeota archaeon]|nr:hypothetical protein [Candidatus Woesearchaeota archaeon]